MTTPALFLAHGNPMNALADNPFTRALAQLGKTLPKPASILMISAHWDTADKQTTRLTHMAKPKTIHDFGGFPKALFEIQYPAPGNPNLAEEIQGLLPGSTLDDTSWGLDHGAWSVLLHMYPEADIPVVQLSLDLSKPPEYHFSLGQKLKPLREKNILIIGSGNIVHNLRTIFWEDDARPLDWAIEFDQWSKSKLLFHDFKALTHDFLKTEAGRMSIPTPEHYYPLLYVLGSASETDEITFIYEGLQNATISMRSVQFG